MSDDLDVATRWTTKQWDEGMVGVDLGDVKTAAPAELDYDDITFPYLRLAVMRLAMERDQLDYE